MVISPNSLFKSQDFRLMPLNVSVIKSFLRNGIKVTYLYFNGERTNKGCPRIFGVLREPQNAKQAALVLLNPEDNVIKTDLSAFNDSGITTLCIDYAGDFLDKERFTIYPSGLKMDYSYNSTFDPDKIKFYPQYHYTTSSLRALYLLEEMGYFNYFTVGFGDGTAISIRTQAMNDNVKFGVNLFSAPHLLFEKDDIKSISYHASFAEESYVPLIKTPILNIVSANSSKSPTARYSELIKLCDNPNSRIYISPVPIEKFNSTIYKTASNFINAINNGKPPNLSPTIYSDEDSLYLNSECKNAKKLTLYYSTSNKDFRLWHVKNVEKIGEASYLTKIDLPYPSNVTAYFNAEYDDGSTYSSTLFNKNVTTTTTTSLKKNHIILDDETPTEYFYNETTGEVSTREKGIFDIEGIFINGTFSTILLSDEKFKGEKQDNLSFLVYSKTSQTITFTVKTLDNVTFTYSKNIESDEKWQNLILETSNFKSNDSSAFYWENVLSLSITADNLLINSILWV